MTELDIELICRIARNSINAGLDFAGINFVLLDLEYYKEEVSPEDINFFEVLKSYCYNLTSQVVFDQANYIACDYEYQFEPRETIDAILKNKHNIESKFNFDLSETDYLDMFNNYVEFLNAEYDMCFETIIIDTAEKVYEILSEEDDFMQSVEEYFEF